MMITNMAHLFIRDNSIKNLNSVHSKVVGNRKCLAHTVPAKYRLSFGENVLEEALSKGLLLCCASLALRFMGVGMSSFSLLLPVMAGIQPRLPRQP
jgi:3-oxoacyl-[acyl-carrier-protein] synthase III